MHNNGTYYTPGECERALMQPLLRTQLLARSPEKSVLSVHRYAARHEAAEKTFSFREDGMVVTCTAELLYIRQLQLTSTVPA